MRYIMILAALLITACTTTPEPKKWKFKRGDCIDESHWVGEGRLLNGNEFKRVLQRTIGGYVVEVCTGSRKLTGSSNFLGKVECRLSAIDWWDADVHSRIRCPAYRK